MTRTLGPLGPLGLLGPTPSLSGPPNRRTACRNFLESLKLFNEGQVSQMFYKANKGDIPTLTKKINDKVIDVKTKYTQHVSVDVEKITDEFEDFLRELLVEYGEIGIKETFDKIKKIYNLLEFDAYRQEDFRIVGEIRQEYIDTKKIPKSTMLYLNKVYKELKVKKEDDDVQKAQQQQQINYDPKAIW